MQYSTVSIRQVCIVRVSILARLMFGSQGIFYAGYRIQLQCLSFVHPCLRCITILPFSHFLCVSCVINDEECFGFFTA